jgi:hypothetical protein
MKIWYIHNLAPHAHERNNYRWKAIRDNWAGHEFELINLYSKEELRRFERSNSRADVAFICDFHSAEKLANSRMDVVKHMGFRAYITGAGWRRPEWVKRGLEGIDKIKPQVVFLSHRPLMQTFKEKFWRTHYVGLGFDPNVFCQKEIEKTRSVVLCGNTAMGRLRRLELMAKKFNGVEWRNGMGHAEMADFLRSGLIGWNQIANGPEARISCNLRTYEVLGCELFLLCSKSRHLDFLEDGKHYVSWSSDADLLDKVRYYLRCPDRRVAIAKAGCQYAHENFTWAHRAQEYQEIIEGIL